MCAIAMAVGTGASSAGAQEFSLQCGACCLQGGDCRLEASQADCEESHPLENPGVYQGTGTSCFDGCPLAPFPTLASVTTQ